MFSTCRFFSLATVFLLLMSTPAVRAAEPSNDDGIYRVAAKLKTPKSDKDKRAPRPLDEAPFAIWLPPDVQTVRGAVVNPFYEKTVYQQHWRAAAAQWGFAVIGCNFFGVNGDEIGPAMLQGLEQLAKTTGHAEIKNLPLCFVGMSAGGGMSTRLAEALADRTIAAGPVCLEVGPRDEASRQIPILTVFGERDGKQMEKLAAKLPLARAQSAQWATAVQWRKRHEFARANNLVMPFFDQVIRHRYSANGSPANGVVKLMPFKETEGWLGDPRTWHQQVATVASFTNYKGDRKQACWFPNGYVAHAWRSFVSKDSPIKLKEPAGMGDGKAFTSYQAGASIAVKFAIDKDWKDSELAIYSGNVRLAAPSSGTLETEITLKEGIHPLFIVATAKVGRQAISPPNTIIVVKK